MQIAHVSAMTCEMNMPVTMRLVELLCVDIKFANAQIISSWSQITNKDNQVKVIEI
jgi:hypothetical protein